MKNNTQNQNTDQSKARWDADALLAQVSVEILSGWIQDITGSTPGREVRCPNPDHTDTHPSCGVFEGSDGLVRFKCQSCGVSGNVFSFLRLACGAPTERARFGEVIEQLAELLGNPPSALLSDSDDGTSSKLRHRTFSAAEVGGNIGNYIITGSNTSDNYDPSNEYKDNNSWGEPPVDYDEDDEAWRHYGDSHNDEQISVADPEEIVEAVLFGDPTDSSIIAENVEEGFLVPLGYASGSATTRNAPVRNPGQVSVFQAYDPSEPRILQHDPPLVQTLEVRGEPGATLQYLSMCARQGTTMSGFRPSSDDVITQDHENVEIFSRMLGRLGIDLRHNIFASRVEYQLGTTDIWLPWGDIEGRVIRRVIRDIFRRKGTRDVGLPVEYKTESYYDLIVAAAKSIEIHPVREWLWGLEPWDGVPRIRGLLTNMFGVTGSPYAEWVSQAIFLGPVQRVMIKAGVKMRAIPTLVGRYNIGKSAFVRHIIPPAMQETWYDGGFSLSDADPKTTIEQLSGIWIVELAELAGARKADIEHFKKWSTNASDRARIAYAREAITQIRQFYVIGTANPSELLPPDQAVASRFAVIELEKGCDVEGYLEPIREQLWAEALYIYNDPNNNNTAHDVPNAHKHIQEKMVSRYFNIDDDLKEKIDELGTNSTTTRWRLLTIAHEVGFLDEEREQHFAPHDGRRLQLARIVTQVCKWKKIRSGGATYYEPPTKASVSAAALGASSKSLPDEEY